MSCSKRDVAAAPSNVLSSTQPAAAGSRELEIEARGGGAALAASTSGLHPSAPVLAFCGKEGGPVLEANV